MAKKAEKAEQITERLAEIDAEERRLHRTLIRLRHARELLVLRDDVPEDDLTFIEQVTARHGQIFAKVFLADALKNEGPSEAFGLTGVIEWPDDEEDESPAKLRYSDLVNQILERTLDAVERAISEAFVRIATDVIERERERELAKDR